MQREKPFIFHSCLPTCNERGWYARGCRSGRDAGLFSPQDVRCCPVETTHHCTNPTPPDSSIIIIDGLDGCEDVNSQRDILTLIAQVTMDPDVAIQFIIASRPEFQICNMFNKEPLFSKTRRLVLDEGYNTAADIERYLREKFEEI